MLVTKVTKVTLAIKGHLGRWTLLQKQRPLLQQLRPQQRLLLLRLRLLLLRLRLRALLRPLLLQHMLKVLQEPRDGLDQQDVQDL